MRRFNSATLAVLAGLAFATPALAGTPILTAIQPKVGNNEYAGARTSAIINVPAAGGAPVVDTEALVVNVAVVDSAGTVLAPPFAATSAVVGNPVAYDNAAGNTITVDFSTSATLATTLANPAIFGMQFQVQTTTGVGFLVTPFSANEANDEIFTKDITAPFLSSAKRNSGGTLLFLTFSESLNNGAGANDVNQTVIANISAADLQFNTSNTFDGTQANPLGLSNPTFLDPPNNTTVRFDLAGTNDAAVGNWFRPSYSDAATTSTNDFRDIVKNKATAAAAQIGTVSALALASSQWVLAVPEDGGAVADSLRVVFNNPVDPSNLGNAAFYNHLNLASAASDLVVTAVAADSTNANAVLLTVSSPGGSDDSVAANGRDTDTNGQYAIALDASMGTPVQDIFSQTFTGSANSNITDGIVPALAIGSPTYVDSLANGFQNGAKLVFNEPLLAASATASGIVLTLNAGATVHPEPDINLTTGVRTTRTTAGTPAIPVATATISSTDVNGNGTIDPLETNNSVVWTYNPLTVDWDNDTTTGTTDTNEAFPGDDDSNVVLFAMTAATTNIRDSAGNAFATNISANTSVDQAGPSLLSVNYYSGDNFAGGMQKIIEQDGSAGDDTDNNIAQIVFSEPINAGGVDPTKFRFGTGPAERFSNGDSDGTFGADNNILQLSDNQEGGFAPGDLLTVQDGSNVFDNADNALAAVTTGVAAVDRTAPFIPLQRDINGSDIYSAFLIDTDSDGFADRLDLYFTSALDPTTVQIADFSVQGVTNAALATANPTFAPAGGGTRLSLNLPPATISASSVVQVTYNGAADTTPIAGTNGNAVAAMNASFNSQSVPLPDSAGEDPAVMEIVGHVTEGATSVPAGTKIFGFIAAPTAKSIRGTIGNLSFNITDSSSLEAFTNFFLGIEPFVYMYDNQGSMYFRNTKQNNGQTSITQLTVNAANLTTVTFTGKGTTTPSQNGGSPVATNLTAGTVIMGWDVLRSSDGTEFDLKSSGVGGSPIASTAVIPDDQGNYRLHMTAPISAFNGLARLNAVGWPVIICVELPNGQRSPASGLLNKVGGGGYIPFSPNNRNQVTPGSTAPQALTFDINLTNIGEASLYEGWNLLNYARVSGFATAAGVIPTLPRGLVTADVFVPAAAKPLPPNATSLSSLVYFFDDNNDGKWTSSDDDDAPFDTIIIDVNCICHFAFTMTSRGVKVSSSNRGVFSNGIDAVVGGYGVGFFNGQGGTIGAFRFGAPITPGAIFSTTTGLNTGLTLGWYLVSSVPTNAGNHSPASDTPTEFFSNNPNTDFFIQFDRTGNHAVDIATSRRLTASTQDGDATSVPAQALFVHYIP